MRYDAGRIVAPTVAGSGKIIWTDIVAVTRRVIPDDQYDDVKRRE